MCVTLVEDVVPCVSALDSSDAVSPCYDTDVMGKSDATHSTPFAFRSDSGREANFMRRRRSARSAAPLEATRYDDRDLGSFGYLPHRTLRPSVR